MKESEILASTSHRPWPVPKSPWIMRQTWRSLLFAHWPVAPDAIRDHIPDGLTLDTYEDEAWIGIVPFRMTDVRIRALPPVPTAADFGEINVRTYVTAQGKPGVLFISLDAGSLLAVLGARTGFLLPYYHAHFAIEASGDTVRYENHRLRSRSPVVAFAARYQPTGPGFEAQAGSLEDFLTARYCLYTAGRTGRLYRGEIHHVPWELQMAEADIVRNSMASAQGIALPDTPPLLHYARETDMVCWPIQPVG